MDRHSGEMVSLRLVRMLGLAHSLQNIPACEGLYFDGEGPDGD